MRIVYVMPDSSVLVREVCSKPREGEQQEQWLDRHARKRQPADAQYWACVEESTLPKGYREAWVWDGSKVVVDPRRIKAPEAIVTQQTASGEPVAVDLSQVHAEIQQIRAQAAQSILDMRNDLLRYHYELQYAINAQKPDSALQTDNEATTANNIRTRDMARQRLAAIGAPRNMTWDQVAEEIVMVHNRDADTLVAP